jgi:transposase InsO family protein
MVENETDSKVKCLRSGNGGEFTSKEFMEYYIMHGVKRQFSIARKPQQNGVVERKNKTIEEMARTILMDSKLTNIFWTHAVHKIVHIPCQCFIETCIGDLAKTSTNKTYQERKRYPIWKNEKIYSHYSNEMMIDT